MTTENIPVRDYRKQNRKYIEAFDRHLQARGNSPETRRSYARPMATLVEAIGSQSVLELERFQLRQLFLEWNRRGLHPNSMRLYTNAFRAFFKFAGMAGLTTHDPSFLIEGRKLPSRLPIVLTIQQIQQLVAAARDPFDRAVPEVLYATGARVSELTNLRLEDIIWGDPSSLRIHRGKGGKDRVVMLGSYAKQAIREYQKWRPSQNGYLFEAPPRVGAVSKVPSLEVPGKSYWHGRYYLDGVQCRVSLGSTDDIPTKEEARQALEAWLKNFPTFKPKPVRPYSAFAIRAVLNRLAHRAGIPKVHPHAFRRAMATHLLQAGAGIREVQELLGHKLVTTTMRYTVLNQDDVRRVYEKAHPHAKGSDDDGTKE